MLTKTQMTDPDFQKLLQVALTDLTIRRTLVENTIAEVNQEMRSLEKDDRLDKLDLQIQAIAADYDHYSQYVDPNFKLDIDQEYSE
ncbi:hypothetical protein FD04_GL000727 [Secundilactobacillus odoratitofui DSM 19909 = JCM 15043]|uniref:Uncharacterized protein n=1 Tax=Secundilactobacillus odoratitofui DSM 19909 = JCM 15043 TaxID=1423776 RepID=A0A0R1LPN0_9LACO|nr:hypothetical protein [Secundilactobacillus odoratitofui]KRK97757.1 hypothetical protein FD04_GL000727 [Secundilactobacillus odoratitofui DSM 19909 = JCM 15043]